LESVFPTFVRNENAFSQFLSINLINVTMLLIIYLTLVDAVGISEDFSSCAMSGGHSLVLEQEY
jgi:hypothetical protein